MHFSMVMQLSSAIGIRNEGPRPPFVLAAGDHVDEVETALDMRRIGKAGADMLCRAGAAGIERVDVHQEIVGNVPADHRPLEEMHIVQVMDELGGVQQVLRRRLAIFPFLDIDDMHGRTRRAVIDAGAGKLEVLLRVTGVERDVARRNGQHVLDQRPRKAEAPILAEDRAGTGHDLGAGLRRIGKADLFQRVERCLVDASDCRLGQWLVLATGKTGTNRPDVFGERRRTKRNPRRPTPGPSRSRNCAFLSHHSSPNGAVVVCSLPLSSGLTRGEGQSFRASSRSRITPAPAPPSGRTWL
jgi:hypothetical protein